MLLSGAVGMVVFALWPVAPPRLADLGLVDTVTEYSRSYRVLQPPAFTNQYAAMPSLHVGWDLLIGLAIIVAASRLWVRVVGGLLPVLMGWAVVATANHFVLDAVVGVLLVLVSLWLVTRRPSLTSRVRRRPTVAGAPGPRTFPGAPP
jgi:membrane-associated phospholipid phosphatase